MKNIFGLTRLSPILRTRCRFAAVLLATLFVSSNRASAQLFTTGDLVVSTYGNVGNNESLAAFNGTMSSIVTNSGGVPLDGVATPISLLEFSSLIVADSSPVSTYTLPDTDGVGGASNLGIVGEIGSSSEGTIQLSSNDQYLTLAGYSATPSFAGIGTITGTGVYQNTSGANNDALAQSNPSSIPRVVALIDANGNVNSSTVFNNIYVQNNPRSVYSQNGTNLYIAGQGTNAVDQGIFYAPVGTNTSITSTVPSQIYSATDARDVQIYNGNLYYSVDKKNLATGIFEYSGTPTTAPTVSPNGVDLLPANNGAGVNYSPDGFFFANSTTLYVADTGSPKNTKNNAVGNGGIEKWSLVSGNWVLDYTLKDSSFVTNFTLAHGESGFASITGKVVGTGPSAVVDLYATSYTLGDADPDGLYGITDVLAQSSETGENFTEIAASNADYAFKGVSFAPTVPEPSTYAMLFGAAVLAFAVWKQR